MFSTERREPTPGETPVRVCGYIVSSLLFFLHHVIRLRVISNFRDKMQVTNHTVRQDDIDPDNMTYEVVVHIAEFCICVFYFLANASCGTFFFCLLVFAPSIHK